jgi:hypothetical protein
MGPMKLPFVRMHIDPMEVRMLENWKVRTGDLSERRLLKHATIWAMLVGICMLGSGCAPKTSTVYALLDLGGGGSGFAATLYAQEVTTGKTVHVFQSAGSHGLVVLPTSEPVAMTVEAPGTYVFYARLINEPDSYHFGATGCLAGEDCKDADLLAIEAVPGESYHVIIADRKALLPKEGEPVTVPWKMP